MTAMAVTAMFKKYLLPLLLLGFMAQAVLKADSITDTPPTTLTSTTNNADLSNYAEEPLTEAEYADLVRVTDELKRVEQQYTEVTGSIKAQHGAGNVDFAVDNSCTSTYVYLMAPNKFAIVEKRPLG